ncbi:hypothetical protein GDO86_017582 [Hymenochirus boettgeri]|uniref:Uncharacterized protein n=1 Tax=Hymenochirus boettgeri TaxID=247094 RepID=A0A8T2IK78_9PIPI|nr:hypothetical protein GDO86_017582 [Hymenochirus boettgeri]
MLCACPLHSLTMASQQSLRVQTVPKLSHSQLHFNAQIRDLHSCLWAGVLEHYKRGGGGFKDEPNEFVLYPNTRATTLHIHLPLLIHDNITTYIQQEYCKD